MPKRDSQLPAEIGRRMAKRRKALGLTQEAAAERSGLSHQFYACLERGAKGPSAESIQKICRGLDTSADYLILGKMPPEERQYTNRMLERLNEEQREAAREILKSLLRACGCELPQ